MNLKIEKIGILKKMMGLFTGTSCQNLDKLKKPWPKLMTSVSLLSPNKAF